MLRLPEFTLHRPRTPEEAVSLFAEVGGDARYVAGGTDLFPNMKRRQQTPSHVISLARIESLSGVRELPDGAFEIGAMTTLAELERHEALRRAHPAFVRAVREISTPLLRNTGTIGGNLLLDTRCTYYDQTLEWRESIDFCMKKDGAICWVAPGSKRCYAVQSSDTVPVVTAIDAEVELLGPSGGRRVACADLYRDDGIAYLTKEPGELLVSLRLQPPGGARASYLKLRRRGSFDFPILGVGACLWFDGSLVARANVRIGGAGSWAIPATETEKALVGREPTDEVLAEAAALAMKPARAMDNTDLDARWRRKMAPIFVARALAECRPESARASGR
ncbi:MAG: xanthine dehydrogenase family protein subunit M [Planctomycetota bacterium]